MSSSSMMSLGDRMKAYEAAEVKHDGQDYVLPCDGSYLIARIDGHNFSTFSRGFQKPYDGRLSYAMVSTAKDLLEKFQARTAYTQSDEITLIFAPIKGEENGEWRPWPHKGRLVKLCTLFSSFASARFNFHLNDSLRLIGNDSLSQSVLDKISRQEAHFDARLFAVPSATEAYNNVYWRATYDCARNSVHGLAMCHFSTKELHGKNRNEMKTMLKTIKVDYDDMPDEFKYGIFVKKKSHVIDVVDKKTGENGHSIRTCFVTFSQKTFDVEMVDSQYLPERLQKIVESTEKDAENSKVIKSTN